MALSVKNVSLEESQQDFWSYFPQLVLHLCVDTNEYLIHSTVFSHLAGVLEFVLQCGTWPAENMSTTLYRYFPFPHVSNPKISKHIGCNNL